MRADSVSNSQGADQLIVTSKAEDMIDPLRHDRWEKRGRRSTQEAKLKMGMLHQINCMVVRSKSP